MRYFRFIRRRYVSFDTLSQLNVARRDDVQCWSCSIDADMLEEAYPRGIFPWPVSEDHAIPWCCPVRRFVLPTHAVHIPKSLRKTLGKRRFVYKIDGDFDSVIRRCATIDRGANNGSWITPSLIDAYSALHERGLAHCVECYEDGVLVGGLYGECFGSVFFGESMFAARSDASKCAFAVLTEFLKLHGVSMIDCQAHTEHLERFGAVYMSREDFLNEISVLVAENNVLHGKRWNEYDTILNTDCLESLLERSKR